MDKSISNEVGAAAGSSYDEAPYPSAPFPQSHPDRLCAMARLFGLNAPPPKGARVLELGCADGSNLLPMAQLAPEARFLGIDASARQVAVANAAIKAVGLTNVEIRQQNILDFPAAEGKFDYIIAHGIYSWVPQEVRDRILTICREHLSENGIAYVSYNTFPGWSMRMALREMMLFHTRGIRDSKTKVQQARALTAFLTEAVGTESTPYGLMLKQELGRMKTQADNYLRHDLLGDINQPVYFREFIAQADKAGLQYVGEPSLAQMLATNFPDKVKETLNKTGSNLIAQEQYMDFVRNRSFRQSLLCHQGAKLSRRIRPEILKDFFFTAKILRPKAESPDLRPGVLQSFTLPGSTAKLSVGDTFLKAAFDTLCDYPQRRVSFQELMEAARARASSVGGFGGNQVKEEATLLHNLMQLYSQGIIDVFAERPTITTAEPTAPEATPLARYQAEHARSVTTRAHVVVNLDILGRSIVAACDGKRDRAALVEHLVQLNKQGKLRMAEADKPVSDEARVRAVLENRVTLMLPKLAAAGLF